MHHAKTTHHPSVKLAWRCRFDEFDQQEIRKHEKSDFATAKRHGRLAWRNDDRALGAQRRGGIFDGLDFVGLMIHFHALLQPGHHRGSVVHGCEQFNTGSGAYQKTTVNFLQRIGELLALEPVPNYCERADFLLEVSTGYADMMELESRDHNLIAHAGFLR